MAYTFEIIGVIFILVMIYFTFLQFKRRTLTKFTYFFWNIIWVGGIILIIFHTFVNQILPPLQIVRVMDLYMILAFMLLFSIIFYLFAKNRKIEQRLEDLTREFALKEMHEHKHNPTIIEEVKHLDKKHTDLLHTSTHSSSHKRSKLKKRAKHER